MAPQERPFNSALICVVLAGAMLAAFSPVLRNDFINCDDGAYVTHNPVVQGGLTWPGVQWAFSSGHSANWHPLTWLSHMLDVELFGTKAAGHHATSLLLHIASTLLLFLNVRKMTGAVWRSVLVAGLFGLHPLRVESVAWVAERKDVLSTLFFMLTLWAYIQYARARAKFSTVDAPSEAINVSAVGGRAWYILTIAFFACGLMSKPMVVTLPFVLLLLDFWPLRRLRLPKFFGAPIGGEITGSQLSLLKSVVEKSPMFLLTIVACILTYQVQHAGGAAPTLTGLGPVTQLLNAASSYLLYIWKAVWPVGLAPFYPYDAGRAATLAIAALPLILAASWLAWRNRVSRPYLLMGWLWYLGTLVPVIGLVQVGNQAMADRYTYIPLVGFFLATVWGVAEVSRNWTVGMPVKKYAAAFLAVGLSCLTFAQAERWRNSESLFRYTVAVTRNNALAHHSLGVALAARGNFEEAYYHFSETVRSDPNYTPALSDLGVAQVIMGQIDEAISNYRRALQLNPQQPHVQYNLGAALARQSKHVEAAEAFAAAVQMDPTNAANRVAWAEQLGEVGKTGEALVELDRLLQWNQGGAKVHFTYASIAAAAGQFEQALDHFDRALAIDSGDPEIHRRKGLLLARAGQVSEAEKCFRELIRLRTDADGCYNLGLTLTILGHYSEAVRFLRQALQLDADLVPALNDLAWILATHPDPALRNGPEALLLAQRACALTGHKVPQFLGTLDAACAEAGDFPRAITTARQVVALAKGAGQPDLAEMADKRLEQYAISKPWRIEVAPPRSSD